MRMMDEDMILQDYLDLDLNRSVYDTLVVFYYYIENYYFSRNTVI